MKGLSRSQGIEPVRIPEAEQMQLVELVWNEPESNT
jgi:hypothetical protein